MKLLKQLADPIWLVLVPLSCLLGLCVAFGMASMAVQSWFSLPRADQDIGQGDVDRVLKKQPGMAVIH